MNTESVSFPPPADRIALLIPTCDSVANLKVLFDSLEATITNNLMVEAWLYIDEDDISTIEFAVTARTLHVLNAPPPPPWPAWRLQRQSPRR